MDPTTFILVSGALVLALFVGLLALQELGRRAGRARAERTHGESREGLGSIEGAVYGLLGLLLAFTFSGAASRFEGRRTLILQEATAIETAYRRLDLLPADARAPLRAKMGAYLDARLSAQSAARGIDAAQAALARSRQLRQELWDDALVATQSAGSPAPQMILPALNSAFDVATARAAAIYVHPPVALFVMLVGLALVAAFLVGNSMGARGTRDTLHMMAYAGVLAVVIYVIVDLEFPRLGFIRVDASDRVLIELRQTMPPGPPAPP
ncbi:MAG TPA: DUF4239 domain-containing protein [Vicinamibacteria bacterium]|nr:DUF4239 domain-containing protein [Vicinamibacteria bacterium]